MRTILRIALSIILSMSIMFVNPLTGNKYTFASEGIYFKICPNQSQTSTITITAHPDNTETCHVTISWEASWLNISPSEVNIAPGGKKDVEATINSNGLEPGDYTDKIMLESNCKPSYSEIPIQIRVLQSVIQVDDSSKELEIPSFGTTNEQFTILNRLCDTVVTFHADESLSDKIELSVPDRTSIKQGERLRIPVKIKSQEFIKAETHRIYIKSFGIDVAMITLRLVPILTPPIVTVMDLIKNHVKWNKKEVIVSTHLLNFSTPLLCDRIPVCSTKMEDNSSFIQVHDPSRYLSDYKYGQAMLCTFTGTFSDGVFTLTKPVEKHYDSILDYEEIFDSSNHFEPFPVQSNHFLLYIQGDSNFPPLLHEQLSLETLKPLSNLPFNRNNSHIFFPFKASSFKTDDTFSSECIRKYSIANVEEALKSLNEPMRKVLRTKEKPTLLVHLSGTWHEKDGKLCLLINNKHFYLDVLKEYLMKLSILGHVTIVSDSNFVDGLNEELSSIGNCAFFDSSCIKEENAESTAVCYPFSLATSFYEKIQAYINPKDCDINWIKLLQNIRKDCTFINGLRYSNKLECSIVERKKSLVRDNVDVIRYKIKAIQNKTKINIDNTERSTHKETIFWLEHPVSRIEPSPICPPVPFPLDLSLQPLGKLNFSKPILLNGTVTKLDEPGGNFEVDSFFDVRYRIEMPERPIEVQEGDKVKITGTLQGDTTVIPKLIEIIEKECAIGISNIDSEVYCPTCFTWDYAEGAYAEYQDLEYVLTNSGDIGAAISVSSSIKQIEGSLPITFKIAWNPASFPLPAKSTFNLGGKLEIHNVPELVPEIQVFLITTTFTISPEPCPKKIVKKFMVTLCPTERTIKGRASFKNVDGKQCGIANAEVRLYLRYDPKCGHDQAFTVEMGALEGVYHNAKQDLPDYSLYLESKTDSKGYYHFHFIDKDCMHDYRVLVLFKNEYMNLTYQDCANTFFMFSDIDGVQKPCRETITERNMYIGVDTNLVFPSDFQFDARSIAQMYCHMMESFSIFASLKCGDDNMIKKNMLPLKVCGYSNTNGTYYQPRDHRKINIDKTNSPINSVNRPHNREWHEFGHFLHDSLMGITDNEDGNDYHGGFRNSNSHDSLVEGIAEFTSLMISRLLKTKSSCCDDNNSLRNGLYRWVGGTTDMENDNNLTAQNAEYGYYRSPGDFVAVNRRNTSVNSNGQLVDSNGHILCVRNSDEEFAVAAALLDLVDNAGWYDETTPNAVIHGTDDDGFFMSSWQDIYCLIKNDQPQTMKDLYDSLQEKYRGNRNALQKINNIFVKQGFFQDKDNNGRRDAGENIGTTYRPAMRCQTRDNDGNLVLHNIPAIPARPDVPAIHGSCIKVRITDSEGKPVQNERMKITAISLDSKVYFTYYQMINDDSLLYVYLPPNSNELLRITLADRENKVLLISTDMIWESVSQRKPYILETTFDYRQKPSHSVWHVKLQPEETINVIENTKTSGRFVYWNESSALEDCTLLVDRSWVNIPNPVLDKTSGLIDFTIDATGLPTGRTEVMVTHRQNGTIIDYLLCVNVLPSNKIITLSIGKKEATINGETFMLDATPFIQPPGRTLVPLRFISEAFGASIDYFPKSGNVTDVLLLFRCIDIHLQIGSTKAEIMDEETTLESPPIIKGGRTFVPLRFISESFGASIEWDGKEQKITITLEEVVNR